MAAADVEGYVAVTLLTTTALLLAAPTWRSGKIVVVSNKNWVGPMLVSYRSGWVEAIDSRLV